MRVDSDIVPSSGKFEVISDFSPSGDQPAAIADLERRIRAGERDVVVGLQQGERGTEKRGSAFLGRVGSHGKIVSIDQYGASADYERIYREFGVTADAVAAAAEDSIRVATG